MQLPTSTPVFLIFSLFHVGAVMAVNGGLDNQIETTENTINTDKAQTTEQHTQDTTDTHIATAAVTTDAKQSVTTARTTEGKESATTARTTEGKDSATSVQTGVTSKNTYNQWGFTGLQSVWEATSLTSVSGSSSSSNSKSVASVSSVHNNTAMRNVPFENSKRLPLELVGGVFAGAVLVGII